MLTKREILKSIIKNGTCRDLNCRDCPYKFNGKCNINNTLIEHLLKIGAMAILRQKPKKREFDINKVLTCVTAAQAVIGTKGYFGDSLGELEHNFKYNRLYELQEVRPTSYALRFQNKVSNYGLFYPMEDKE